jgi:uncharacterized protein
MSELVTALGLVLALEGLAYAAAPGAFKRMAAMMQALPEDRLRIFGVAALAVGTGLVWLARYGLG